MKQWFYLDGRGENDMKNIYILYTCNEWKEYSSMSLVAASTSIRKIKSIIIQEIKDGDMEYKGSCSDENASIINQIKALRKDWEEFGEYFVFEHLEYGYVETVEDGEIQ